MTLRFAPVAVPYVERRRWPGQISAGMDGNTYRLTLRVPLNHQHLPIEVMAWIRGWGPRVEVLSPDWVHQLWLKEAQELLQLYSNQVNG